LLDQLTSAQLSEWEAYDRLDPVGSWRSDFMVAKLMSLIENIARTLYGGEGVKMTTPKDYMPEWGMKPEKTAGKEKQSMEEMKQIMFSIACTQNKRCKALATRNLHNNPPKTKKK